MRKFVTSHTDSVITRVKEASIVENVVQDMTVNGNGRESDPAKRYHVEKLGIFVVRQFYRLLILQEMHKR